MDYWNAPMPDMRPVLTLVPGEKIGAEFLVALNKSRIGFEVTADNFQKMLNAERDENSRNLRRFRSFFDYQSTYHSYDEIIAELQRVSTNNSKVVYNSMGKSYEGRQIPFLTITNTDVKEPKKTVVFECGIHAREWVSTATCLWMANTLITDSINEELLKKFEFIVIPSLNPDGYVYSHTVNRMWRKTRSPQRGGQRGADPNRNFDSHFGQAGTQLDPSGEAYPGPKPFSEVETKALANLVLSKRGQIAAYFAIHSFSQLWMYPYGYTSVPPPNYAQLERLSTRAVDAIRATSGLVFNKGTIARTIYKASGSSIDWAYDSAGCKVVFALELRDKGQYGFILPPSQIRSAATETWAGIKAVLGEL
ncbi:unnamed protein product [Medioppia subpectinata]|uniref:Peptidase M14 domain-containing protein n=1 Tax=Medioppia subpectinata TaxID=1979941 RepID=A0A7R9L891_9ACAR|nr:unnamed protein product [Medioppia subpectinata]CAG2116223.1 unnamed protein product [Medioppia subpectinata]